MGAVKNVQKQDSVRVEDGMRSTQLPGSLIVAADTVLREMCRRGNTSPELRVYYGTRNNLTVWCGVNLVRFRAGVQRRGEQF